MSDPVPLDLAFEKYEGLGNDFVLVDASSADEISPSVARGLCDRRFGIGADGVLLLLPSSAPGVMAAMHVINADGSVPEMCGNGLRCVALHLARRHGHAQTSFRVATGAGVRTCEVEPGSNRGVVTVDMGTVRVGAERSLWVDGDGVSFVPADAGNPHAVMFGAFEPRDIERLGPRLATDPSFPGGTNVEFARVSGGGIDLVVWERGVGLTLACGTGACATVAVACARGMFAYGSRVEVRLPGGTLAVTAESDGRVRMRGPATHVFSGTVRVDSPAAITTPPPPVIPPQTQPQGLAGVRRPEQPPSRPGHGFQS